MGKSLGFTGTRHRLTEAQLQKLKEFLELAWRYGFRYFHHGDCVGADATAHEIAQILGFSITIHPPSDERLRAFCQGADLVLVSKPYLARNKDIVNFTQVLVACPEQKQEVLRSGTWSTIRYARSQRKAVEIIWP